jgi:hypothetical protein
MMPVMRRVDFLDGPQQEVVAVAYVVKEVQENDVQYAHAEKRLTTEEEDGCAAAAVTKMMCQS